MKTRVLPTACVFVLLALLFAQLPGIKPNTVAAHHSKPTDVSTDVPTDVSTLVPTDVSTDVPTVVPTDVPTLVPTDVPTNVSTDVPINTKTPKPKNDWKFEWNLDTGCIEPYIRVHNMNNVSVHVEGEIKANGQVIASVPSPYAEVGPDQWGGPEGDLPSQFVGSLTGWVKVTVNGEEVASKSIDKQLNCAPATSTPIKTTIPTITNIPTNTPTGTLYPTNIPPVQNTPTERPAVNQTPVPPNTGAADTITIGKWGLFTIFVIVMLAILFGNVWLTERRKKKKNK